MLFKEVVLLIEARIVNAISAIGDGSSVDEDSIVVPIEVENSFVEVDYHSNDGENNTRFYDYERNTDTFADNEFSKPMD